MPKKVLSLTLFVSGAAFILLVFNFLTNALTSGSTSSQPLKTNQNTASPSPDTNGY